MSRKRSQAPLHSADTRAVNGIRGFAGLPKCVLNSEAYRTLSLIARAILVEIAGRMDGRNNGSIHISYAELAAALNRRNQAPIGPAIDELVAHGLLDLNVESVWRERKAREYRLTFVNTTDTIGRPIRATNDYLQYPCRAKNDATDVVAARPKTVTPFVAAKMFAATASVAERTAAPSTDPPPPAATNGVVPIYLPSMDPKNGATHPPCKQAGCEGCGEPFKSGDRGKPKRFCSETCRKRAERQRAYQRRKAAA